MGIQAKLTRPNSHYKTLPTLTLAWRLFVFLPETRFLKLQHLNEKSDWEHLWTSMDGSMPMQRDSDDSMKPPRECWGRLSLLTQMATVWRRWHSRASRNVLFQRRSRRRQGSRDVPGNQGITSPGFVLWLLSSCKIHYCKTYPLHKKHLVGETPALQRTDISLNLWMDQGILLKGCFRSYVFRSVDRRTIRNWLRGFERKINASWRWRWTRLSTCHFKQ